MRTGKRNKFWDDYEAPPFLDLRTVLKSVLLNNKRSGLLDNAMYANFTAEDTARVILSNETIDFSTEGEDFFNYVWDRFGYDVYRAMLGIVKEQLPTYVLVNILDNFLLRMNMVQGQTYSRQGPFSQQPAVSQQLFLQTFFPQVTISPRAVMGSSNNGYRGRPNWSPFYQNYYPYVRNTVACRRRRSHLDDIYLPNYEDDDLEEKNGFNQQRFRNRRPYWYNNNPPQRSDHRTSSNRTLSFVKRSKESNHNDHSESKTNDLNLRDNATSSTSATSDSCARNCDKIKCETVKVTQVNSNLLTIELQSEPKTSVSDKLDHSTSSSNLNDCANSASPCHNSEDNLKTEDITANSLSPDLTNVTANNSSSVPSVSISSNETPDKMNTTEDSQILELLNNFHGKPNSSDKDDKVSQICDSAIENPFRALKNIDSDEEIDCFGDFITIDKIDTSKSYLKTSTIVLDDYDVIDMDISPLKRKNECDEDEETTKKAKHDSLYFNINSGKLLNEINKVLKENKQSFKSNKRFRSKSLTLNDTRENTPMVRSSSMDSIDKSDVQVSYNFDLKTNLLLLLKPNPTCNETSSSVDNILKVLEDGGEKLTVDKLAPLQKESSNSNNSSESTSANINVGNDGSKQEIKKNYTEGKNFETFIESKQRDMEENVKTVPSSQSTIKNKPCTNAKIEESDKLSTPKRKSSVDHEEQPKKLCLDSIAENIVQRVKASCTNDTENEIAMEKEQSMDHTTSLTKLKLQETNQNNVEPPPLPNKTVSKDSCGESLFDIEEELKSLLGEDSLNDQQHKLRASQGKEHVEDKDQKGVTSNKKIAADAVNADDTNSNKKSLKINSCSDSTCTESSTVKTSNLSREGSNPRKPSEKGTNRSTRKPNPNKQREKQIRNESPSNPSQSKPKDKLIRKQAPAEKKQKSNETHFKNGNGADVATPQPCVNKPPVHEPGEKQIVPGTKTISYYQHFKRIQSLFGSDSESEMEEESLVNAKNIHKVPDNCKNSTNRKIYDESNKREVQTQKQGITELRTSFNRPISDGSMESQKSVNLAEYYINKYIKNVPTIKPSHSLKESSKVIEKRRCSVPITNPTAKFLTGAVKTPNATVTKPKRIEKKRRETLPASLNGGIPKERKPHQGENGQVEKGKVCVINHKLKDPRKEHYKYKSLEKSEQKSESNSIKKCTVKWDPNKIQNKACEKYKNEKKNISCKNSVPKIVNESKKKHVYEKSQENKSKNQEEKDCTSKKERSSEAIVNQLQLKSKFSKTDQSKTIVSSPKELETKIRKKIELTLKTGTQEPVHLQLVQCSTLPRDRFPMLQRANSRIQENECCDKAVALENVDVNEKINVVKQVIDQEDDVIEVREDIPIIDLTNDLVKEKPDDSLKMEVVALSHEIPCKTNEMITLYRSEETVDSSLDIQPTSESISPAVLKNKRSLGSKSNTVEGHTLSKSQNSDNRNDKFMSASSTLYVSPLNNNTTNVSSPARLKFNLIAGSKCSRTQNSNRSPSSNFASPSPPTVPETVKPSEVLSDTQNAHAVRRNNFQTSVTHDSGANFLEITNQVNLTPQTSVEPRQDLVNHPTRSSFSIQNNCQQNSFPQSNTLAQLQQKVDSLHKPTNNSASTRQNPLLCQMISSDNVPGKNAYATHSPMRHPEEEGPAPMHEISMREIRNAGVVLLKYLLLYDSTKKAQWVYKNELLKIQKNMPAIIRLEIYQFESFSSQKDRKLYKDLIKELKSLNLTGRSSNVKSAEVLMEHLFNALQRLIGNLTLWRVYLMLDTLMQPEIAEYMAVPFLRDLFSYVSFVAGKIRSTLPGASQPENTQISSPPQDPFTPNQRKMLEWQIKQYISICSIQKRLTDELQSNISKRLPNGGMGIAQDIQQLPNYASRLQSLAIRSSNQQSANQINPNLTVYQNIIIRPVDVTNLNGPSASNTYSSSKNKDTYTLNDTFRIRLPYTAPYENSPPSTSAPVQEQNLSHSAEAINSQANTQVSVNTQPSPITPQATIESSPTTNKCESADPAAVATSPQQVETDGVIVKQEKETPSLTDQEIETIDLTWINDIDPKQLQSEMEFIAVKKEEPPEEEEIEVELNEEPFAVAPSPADSGISSPPIQVEYDESVFSNRSCICDKVAEYVCGCMMAMYCSVKCQFEDWKFHKDVCQKYKSKTNKSQQ